MSRSLRSKAACSIGVVDLAAGLQINLTEPVSERVDTFEWIEYGVSAFFRSKTFIAFQTTVA